MKNTVKSKIQKRTDNTIRVTLTDLCEQTLKDMDGFKWLTHQANYANFPASLLITCVFDSDSSLALAHQKGLSDNIQKRIQSNLLKIGVRLKDMKRQIIFDTEEACIRDDHNWPQRLARQHGSVVPHSRQP